MTFKRRLNNSVISAEQRQYIDQYNTGLMMMRGLAKNAYSEKKKSFTDLTWRTRISINGLLSVSGRGAASACEDDEDDDDVV